VADRGDLAGLGLAAVERSAEPPGRRPADASIAPEVGGGRLVGHVAQLAVEPSVADPENRCPVNWKLYRCMSIDHDLSPTT